jgi:Uma2 family endonuclease
VARGIDSEPYLEWLDGVESVALSPYPPHGIVAVALSRLIDDAGNAFGAAMVEVHVRVNSGGEKRTVLLPDVAFYRFDALRALKGAGRALPDTPPEILAEVRSPNDRPGFREEKIRRYLAWGCPVVLDASPMKRTIIVHDFTQAVALTEEDQFAHAAVPWLTFNVREAFARLDQMGY